MSVRSVAILAFVQLAVGTSEGAAQQPLAERVAAVGTGTVTFVYPTREDVEICDRGVSIGGRRMMWRERTRGGDSPVRCVRGTASVELRVEGGIVQDVDVLELDEAVDPPAVDLGTVSAPDAAAYFLTLARAGTDDVGEDAVLAAVLANVEDVWRDLLAVAHDPDVQQDVRRASLFWLGQEAGEAVTVEISAIAADEREEQNVREAAIFALSQRPGDVGLEPLMELARTAREAETRRAAMFWLAQSNDARVLAFFEDILLGR